MRAVWNDAVLAESDDTVVVEGNHYFPPESVNWEYLEPSDHHTTCPSKGGPVTTPWSLTASTTPKPPGSTLNPRRRLQRLPAASPSGTASGSREIRARPVTRVASFPDFAAAEPADRLATAVFSPMDQRLVPSGWSDSLATQRRRRAATSEGSRT